MKFEQRAMAVGRQARRRTNKTRVAAQHFLYKHRQGFSLDSILLLVIYYLQPATTLIICISRRVIVECLIHLA